MTRVKKIIDKSFCIATSIMIVLHKYDTSNQLQTNGKERKPQDKPALHGPQNKTLNCKGRKKQSENNNSLSPMTNTHKMKTCEVLCDDDKWLL